MLDVLKLNRQRDLYLSDGDHVYFIPYKWCDAFDPDSQADELEIRCYAPLYTTMDSEVEILWVSAGRLNTMADISEKEARLIHPALFKHLEELNKER